MWHCISREETELLHLTVIGGMLQGEMPCGLIRQLCQGRRDSLVGDDVL